MMESNRQQAQDKRKKTKLKELFPKFSKQTGLPQKKVAKVCRLLFQEIEASIKNEEIFKANTITIKSSLKPAKPANDKRGDIPERRIGKLIIKPNQGDNKKK